ncbi:hypothetical protein TWF694_006995 [Orbilia ellipsospora]|uniref:Uncharacterized protein n=1 Tax=Orbilia ellipsospora TaxID=2528407 RepID=A0AAV9XN95_9PEZI
MAPKPAYSVKITLKNDTNNRVNFIGRRGQTGSDSEVPPPEFIEAKQSGSFSESLTKIFDDDEGFAEYNFFDEENVLLVEIKLMWLSPNPDANRQAQYKSEISGDVKGLYEITTTTDENVHSDVTFTLSKKK